MACRVTPDQKMLVVGYRIHNEIPTPKIRGFLIEYSGKEIEEDTVANGREVDEWNVIFEGADGEVIDSDNDDDAVPHKSGVIPGLGLWIWEGEVTTENDVGPDEDPGDVTYDGEWRSPTDEEMRRLQSNLPIWAVLSPQRMLIPRHRVGEFELGLMRVSASTDSNERTMADMAAEILFLRNALRAIISGNIQTSTTAAVAHHALGKQLTDDQRVDVANCYYDADQSIVLVPVDLVGAIEGTK